MSPLAIDIWNRPLWQRLTRDLGQLTHALLLNGPSGLGKESLALSLAAMALCDRPTVEGACGQCRACELFRAGSHPDLHVITTEQRWADATPDDPLTLPAARYATPDKRDRKPRRIIAVDQVRAAIAAAATNAHMAPTKVFLFTPAEAMNANAANALLKLLEEPPGATVLLLVSHDSGRLPATIRSRCVRVDFRPRVGAGGEDWLREKTSASPEAIDQALNLSGHRPRLALQMLESGFLDQRERLFADLAALGSGGSDPMATAAAWQPVGSETIITWLQDVLADIVRLRCSGPNTASIRNIDQIHALQALSERVDLQAVFQVQDATAGRRALIGGQLDEALVMEEAIIDIHRLLRPTA